MAWLTLGDHLAAGDAERFVGRAAELELDGRDLDPVPGDLEEALEPAFGAERPLLILDTGSGWPPAEPRRQRTRRIPGGFHAFDRARGAGS